MHLTAKPVSHTKERLPDERHAHPSGAIAAATDYLSRTKQRGTGMLYIASRRVDKRYSGDASFVAPTIRRLYDLIACEVGLAHVVDYTGILLSTERLTDGFHAHGTDTGEQLYRFPFSVTLTDSALEMTADYHHKELEPLLHQHRVSRAYYEQVDERPVRKAPFDTERDEVNFLLFPGETRVRTKSEYAARNWLKARAARGTLDIPCERHAFGKMTKPRATSRVHIDIAFT